MTSDRLTHLSPREIGRVNREAVRSFLSSHLGCTNRECSAALGISIMAVTRHVAAIRREWEPSADAMLKERTRHDR